MKRKLQALFIVVEINLVLWLAALAMAMGSGQDVGWLIAVGAAFAALAQHWAYYAIYKQAKQM